MFTFSKNEGTLLCWKVRESPVFSFCPWRQWFLQWIVCSGLISASKEFRVHISNECTSLCFISDLVDGLGSWWMFLVECQATPWASRLWLETCVRWGDWWEIMEFTITCTLGGVQASQVQHMDHTSLLCLLHKLPKPPSTVCTPLCKCQSVCEGPHLYSKPAAFYGKHMLQIHTLSHKYWWNTRLS